MIDSYGCGLTCPNAFLHTLDVAQRNVRGLEDSAKEANGARGLLKCPRLNFLVDFNKAIGQFHMEITVERITRFLLWAKDTFGPDAKDQIVEALMRGAK